MRGPPKQAFRPPAPIQRAKSSSASQSQQQAVISSSSSAQASGSRVNQDQGIVSKEDSIDALRVTLEATIGFVCYIRDLLPANDFDVCYIANSQPPPHKTSRELYYLTKEEATASWSDQSSSQQSQSQIQNGDDNEENQTPRIFNWRRIKKNGSSQARSLNKLLHDGVMDAVRKGFLQSMMLVILLDKDDPANVIETYTFNFFYHERTGNPSLKIEHQQGQERKKTLDQKNEVLGNSMTHLDVRRLVKVLAKSIIGPCEGLADLPRKRFIDLKLFYNDAAPVNYVAPGFEDSSDEQMVLGTEDVDETPKLFPCRQIQTGHHGLSLTAISVADFLPQSGEIEENVEERNVVWDADLPAFDRLAYDSTAHDVYTATIDSTRAAPINATEGLKQPLGRIQPGGDIEVLTTSQKGKGGERTSKPKTRACRGARAIPEETLQMSQTLANGTPPRALSSLPGSDHGTSLGKGALFFPPSQQSIGNNSQSYLDRIEEDEEAESSGSKAESSDERIQTGGGNDISITQPTPLSSQRLAAALHEKVQGNKRKADGIPNEDESPPIRRPRNLGSIVSQAMKRGGYEPVETAATKAVKAKPKPRAKHKPKPVAKSKPKSKPKPKSKAPSTTAGNAQKRAPKKSKRKEEVNCFCQCNDEDDPMIQCDICQKWLHAACLGFIEAQSASQMQVLCIVCRLNNDNSRQWSKDEIDKAAGEMSNLALVRRVILYIRQQGNVHSSEVPEIQKNFGCTVSEIKTVLKKLQDEGLIESVSDSDSDGTFTGWKWLKTPNATKRFTAFFQYGQGVETEMLEKDQTLSTQSKSLSQGNQSLDPPSNSQVSRVPDSQDEDAEGEDDPDTSINSLAANSQRDYSPFKLPPIRSSRARRIINCTDNWTGRDEEGEEEED